MSRNGRKFSIVLIGVAVLLAVTVFVARAPTSMPPSQEIQTQAGNDALNALEETANNESRDATTNSVQRKYSDERPSDPIADGSDSSQNLQPETFSDYMLLPGAVPESYVVIDDALSVSRLEEFATPANYDNFVSQLQKNSDVVSQRRVEAYSKAFYSAAEVTNGSVVVDAVVCGATICAATFRSSNAAMLDEFIKRVQSAENSPMYASVVIPDDSDNVNSVRKIVYTTDPAANSLTL